MPNTSGTWKTGEKVVQEGAYICLDCRERGESAQVTLQAGQIFPYCKTCDVKDNTYKIVVEKR